MRRIRLAERLGFDSLFTAEIYGTDAVTPLAYLASQTKYLRLGTAVAQVAARPPVTTAMQFGSVEELAGRGRVICGLGLSGPQIVEGWYGQPWGRPNPRLRDYVTIVRQVFRREGPVVHEGPQIQVPFSGEGALGIGKPLKSILHMNPDIPIWLATGGPANTTLMAEIADGWLPLGYTPDCAHIYRPQLEKGLARSGRTLADLEIQAGSTVRITDDVKGTIERAKPQVSFLVGGYGTREYNFHRDAMVRRGFGEAAERIQELFMAGRREEATAAVPDEYIDDGALIGSRQRIRQRFFRWADSDATGLTIRAVTDEEMAYIAELAECRPRPDVEV
ncbi:MAG: LLM class F420-dependent oxidoreductase [Proteobacteria bacterium]|nr:LLM class F420-dependent oxidoreductase [Pseudomonadota bacterium]